MSVHGGNRLGGNSLLDIVVFGRAAGIHIVEQLRETRYHRELAKESLELPLSRLARWDARDRGGESVAELRDELQQVMEDYCSVFRTQDVMREGLKKVSALHDRLQQATLHDFSQVFNTARIEALELENMMAIALAVVSSALAREESRGAHSRIDFPERDDRHWLRHSLYFSDQRRLDYKPVRMKPLSVDSFPPKARVY